MKPSILRNLLIGCVSFGVMMGCVFPFIAGFFVEWKEGMFGWFFAACLAAGVASGSAIYGLVHLVLLKRLKIIVEVAEAISQNDISHECQMQSDDMIGEIISAFNKMTANLRNMIGQISGATTQLAAAAEQTSTITDETSRGVQAQQAEIDSIAAAMNEMSGTEMKKIVDDSGLRCTSSHFTGPELIKSLDNRIEWASQMGMKQMAQSMPKLPRNPGLDDWRKNQSCRYSDGLPQPPF
jgi:methyl-accepting chemotaxis protein